MVKLLKGFVRYNDFSNLGINPLALLAALGRSKHEKSHPLGFLLPKIRNLVQTVKFGKFSDDDLTKLTLQEVFKRQSAVSCISTVETGLDVLTNAIRCTIYGLWLRIIALVAKVQKLPRSIVAQSCWMTGAGICFESDILEYLARLQGVSTFSRVCEKAVPVLCSSCNPIHGILIAFLLHCLCLQLYSDRKTHKIRCSIALTLMIMACDSHMIRKRLASNWTYDSWCRLNSLLREFGAFTFSHFASLMLCMVPIVFLTGERTVMVICLLVENLSDTCLPS
ncbi:hypothetical protein D5086_027183 [Populus alba]|uniref:Uncharacterized protein n=1 Tax=Populus alba TaxID=43335 RepID=A0ACC4B5J9_POPAL